MSSKRLFSQLKSAFLLAMLSIILIPAFATADINSIVSGFNSMNSNRGFVFQMYNDQYYAINPGAGEMRLLNVPGNVMPDTSAYTGNGTAGTIGGRDYFQTFCVSPEITMVPNNETLGHLHYDAVHHNTLTTKTAGNGYNGQALTLGAAFLYKQFASGALDYNYTGTNTMRTNDAIDLQNMIWHLQGKPTVGGGNIAYNQYYTYLQNELSGYDVYEAYDLTSDYGGLMGDYTVFVMNTRVENPLARMPGSQASQDVLYIVKNGGGNDIPEPASLLLWVLGASGTFGASLRRRYTKKNA